MFVFAILFFGVVTDAGMFDPIVDRILRAVGTHPTWIVVGHVRARARSSTSTARAR